MAAVTLAARTELRRDVAITVVNATERLRPHRSLRSITTRTIHDLR